MRTDRIIILIAEFTYWAEVFITLCKCSLSLQCLVERLHTFLSVFLFKGLLLFLVYFYSNPFSLRKFLQIWTSFSSGISFQISISTPHKIFYTISDRISLILLLPFWFSLSICGRCSDGDLNVRWYCYDPILVLHVSVELSTSSACLKISLNDDPALIILDFWKVFRVKPWVTFGMFFTFVKLAFTF